MENNSVAVQIAIELHGRDPACMNVQDQVMALTRSAKAGAEQFIDTLVCLLPSPLRELASDLVDKGSAGI